jgi:hypothetical protein
MRTPGFALRTKPTMASTVASILPHGLTGQESWDLWRQVEGLKIRWSAEREGHLPYPGRVRAEARKALPHERRN